MIDDGFQVGLLDIDLCGPSIPTMLGLSKETIRENGQGCVPMHQRCQVCHSSYLDMQLGASVQVRPEASCHIHRLSHWLE
jgi:Mrp family chromosome partitioning ATPase